MYIYSSDSSVALGRRESNTLRIIRILSVIAGGKGWEDMENYGLSKDDWLKQFLALPNGIPCPDTFRARG